MDSPKGTYTRTRKRLLKEEAKAPAQTTPPQSPQEQKKEISQSEPQLLRNKMIAKKTKIPLLITFAYYPFFLTKDKTAFKEIIKGKQPIKERALELAMYSIDKIL